MGRSSNLACCIALSGIYVYTILKFTCSWLREKRPYGVIANGYEHAYFHVFNLSHRLSFLLGIGAALGFSHNLGESLSCWVGGVEEMVVVFPLDFWILSFCGNDWLLNDFLIEQI
jgi:hypothetical protein